MPDTVYYITKVTSIKKKTVHNAEFMSTLYYFQMLI